MILKSKIEEHIKMAMKNKDKDRLRALRSIKSQILLAETDKSGHELNAEMEIKLLQKAAKQRKDSLQIYKEQNRQDLADIEQVELSVIEEFLPAQMTEEEITESIRVIIKQENASGMKDMGKIMRAASQKLAGKVDGSTLSQCVKSLLNNL